MDWLQFTASVIGSLAWPAALAVVALVFRGPIKELLKSVQKLRFREFEAEFGDDVDQIKSDLEEIRDEEQIADEPVRRDLVEIVEKNPEIALVEAWKPVERAIVDLSVKRLDSPRSWPLRQHLNALVIASVIPKRLGHVIAEMSNARNRAAHQTDDKLPKAKVYEFMDIMADVVGVLRRFI